MATNGENNVEDTEMTECDDGEKVVTMMDVLQEQQEFEEDAKAVLGASDDMNCTYSKGYIKRQAIYACLTCCAEARHDETKRAGVCLACSLNCHENHELIELYTKRNFRCDCGNPKFNSHPCTFTPNKTEFNLENNYNQNFSGIYCICHRPYPDPEATEEDEMIQCIICEDWLHANHLDAVVPANDQYSEMVCKACMEKNEFLHDYNSLAVNIEMGDIDILSVNGNDSLSYGTANNTLTNGDGIKDSVLKNTNEMETDVNVTQNDSILENSEKETSILENFEKETSILENSEKETQDSVVKDTNEMETDTNVPQNVSLLENSDKEEKEQPTVESNPQNETEHIEKLTKNVDKVAENNTEEQNETDSETNVKPEVENDQSTNEVEDNTTTESNTAPDTNTDTSEKVEDTETKAFENKGELNDNGESFQQVFGDKDNENSDANRTNLENDALKTNEDNKEADLEKIDSINKPESINDVERQLSDLHKESEENVEAKSEAETPMDTTGNEVSEKESNETSDITAAADSLKEPSEDEIVNSEEVHPESIDKDDESSITVTTKPDSIETDKSDEITSTDNISPRDDQNSTKNNALELSDNLTEVDEPTTEAPNTIEKRKLHEDTDDTLAKKPKLDSQCLRPSNVKRIHKGATFWPSSFRQKLCTCCECITMYKDLSVLFLIDPEDTVSAYETLGKEKFEGEPSTQYEKGLKALSSLDRIQQINALTEYNKMRDKLLDFLKSFKDKKEVVKEEDIRAFFAGMKPKREPDGVYFCR